MAIILITVALQILIVELAGPMVKTCSLSAGLWGWAILFGFISWPWGVVLRRFLPLQEDPNEFFGYEMPLVPLPLPESLIGKDIQYASPRVEEKVQFSFTAVTVRDL